ncbi:hypothetical protein [Streptomyces sp. AC1-42T]|uniref:hypothetical protein n=1 Tax=Streptomyces sp. AC1-42T TaxID=2218665 RepID=UPI000DAE3DF0|nr:hypothetical protein [Streptomyces sp. AC1-42T]PZT71491.1 hypothetical protein DNK55_32790 [Streptomyces sp. AC1-42T]
MRLRHAAAAAVAAAALIFTTATSASATHADGGSVVDPTRGAAAWFKHDGDVFWSMDTKADGHSAVTRVYVPSVGIADNLWNPDGNGAARYKSYGSTIPEGTVVYYQACIGEHGTYTILQCTPGWGKAFA